MSDKSEEVQPESTPTNPEIVVPPNSEKELEKEENNAQVAAERDAYIAKINAAIAASKPKLEDTLLRQIAHDLYTGKIFCDRFIGKHDYVYILPMVFLPLAMCGKEELEKQIEDPPAFFYEYNSEALPRGINGYPCFMSMRSLNGADTKRMIQFFTEIKTAMESVMGKTETPKEAENKPAA